MLSSGDMVVVKTGMVPILKQSRLQNYSWTLKKEAEMWLATVEA